MGIRVRVFPEGLKDTAILGGERMEEDSFPSEVDVLMADDEDRKDREVQNMSSSCCVCGKHVPSGECAFVFRGTVAYTYLDAIKIDTDKMIAHRECVGV